MPTYPQKLKSAKPVVKTVKGLTNETEQVLQACLDLTDWSVYEAAANDLDELTENATILHSAGGWCLVVGYLFQTFPH